MPGEIKRDICVLGEAKGSKEEVGIWRKEWCVYVSVCMCVWWASHRGTSVSYTVTVEACLKLRLPVEWEV